MQKVNYPKVSVILNTNNAIRTIEKCFELLFGQNYPKGKIEVVIPDAGSTDGTLEVIEKYRKIYPKAINLFHNPKKYKLGRGMGADLASRKATGEMILMIDPDNLFVQKDWLKEMVEILINNKDICAVQSGTIVPERGSVVDKYFGAIGIEDPFAIPYSLPSQVFFHPNRFEYREKQDFFVYRVNKRNFYYFGDNGFLIWKKVFFDNDGYTQDIENAYRMAISRKGYKIAVPKKLKIHHNSSNSMFNFLKKKTFYVQIYISNSKETRKFHWFNLKENTLGQNLKFLKNVAFNLLVIPNLLQAVYYSLKMRKSFWFVHPVLVFLITLCYVYSFFYIKITGKKVSL